MTDARFAKLLAVLVAVGCSPHPLDARRPSGQIEERSAQRVERAAASETALELALEVHPESSPVPDDFVGKGRVTNRSEESIVVSLDALLSPSTAIEIVDARGNRVASSPPPLPGEPETVELEPGETYELEYLGFVPPEIAPGRYRARLRYFDRREADQDHVEPVVSQWVEFSVEDPN